MPDLRVGSTVWVFDQNYRVYRKDANGRAVGGPIWREHWRPVVIEGETRVSWMTRYGKIPKKPDTQGRWQIPQGGYTPLDVAFSPEEIDEEEWVQVHRSQIADKLQGCDAATLRQVAALVGYKPEGEPNA